MGSLLRMVSHVKRSNVFSLRGTFGKYVKILYYHNFLYTRKILLLATIEGVISNDFVNC